MIEYMFPVLKLERCWAKKMWTRFRDLSNFRLKTFKIIVNFSRRTIRPIASEYLYIQVYPPPPPSSPSK